MVLFHCANSVSPQAVTLTAALDAQFVNMAIMQYWFYLVYPSACHVKEGNPTDTSPIYSFTQALPELSFVKVQVPPWQTKGSFASLYKF